MKYTEENEVKKAYSEVGYNGHLYRLDYIITSPIGVVPDKIDCYISKPIDDKTIQFGYGSYNKNISTYIRFDNSMLEEDVHLQFEIAKRFYEDIQTIIV